MDCTRIADDLSLLLDDALDDLRVEAVNAHFRSCDSCSRFYQSLREQMVLHRWACDDAFACDAALLPGDIPDYDALAARVNAADLDALGRLLFAILKAEFLFDYGDGLEASEEPISDPRAERLRGAEIIDELRDWHDADEVKGVDLQDVARRLEQPRFEDDRLSLLVQSMGVVRRLSPDLEYRAAYYQAVAHVKASRYEPAAALLSLVAEQAPRALAHPARVCLATLPVLLNGDAEASITALKGCLTEFEADPVVHFNLAKARFLRDGELDSPAWEHLERARQLNLDFVERQLARPGERALREAVVRGR